MNAEPPPAKVLIYLAMFITWILFSIAMSFAACIVAVAALWSFFTKGCVC